MDQTPVQIGQYVLGKNLGIGAFGKVRTIEFAVLSSVPVVRFPQHDPTLRPPSSTLGETCDALHHRTQSCSENLEQGENQATWHGRKGSTRDQHLASLHPPAHHSSV